MKIKWFGHSCFLLTSFSGIKVLTDPYDESTGYEAVPVDADIVTISHDHHDHNNDGMATGDFIKLRQAGVYNNGDVKIEGIECFHDEFNGAKRGANIIFCIDMDGIKLCHCGDLGHTIDESLAGRIGKVDILLVPVGGTYTIDYKGALDVAKILKPTVTIPMHYKTQALRFNIDGVDKFLKAAKGNIRFEGQEFEITQEDLGKMEGIIVMDYRKS